MSARSAATFCLRETLLFPAGTLRVLQLMFTVQDAEKIIARYVEQKRRNRLELDRIDKVLFVLPFLTLADTVSTEFSLMFGGGEGGPIAGPVYERYGQFGLVALSIFAFLRCWVACGFSDMRKGELSKRSCLSQTELF